MIKVYNNGNDFYNDNKDFLLTNPHTECFFRLDAPLLLETNKDEYAIQIKEKNNTLVCLKKNPYNLMFYGNQELASSLIKYLIDENYKITNYLCLYELGETIKDILNNNGYQVNLQMAMDFMIAKEKVDIEYCEVEVATINDLDEIYQNMINFYHDCHLNDIVDKEKIIKFISDYRIIRKNNEVISMARISMDSANSKRIVAVYTKPKYRGLGYAKKVCAKALNDIIDSNHVAVLNVDRSNPISNHIYSSIGFKKLFSQANYEVI